VYNLNPIFVNSKPGGCLCVSFESISMFCIWTIVPW
jgi:hypothetical protein